MTLYALIYVTTQKISNIPAADRTFELKYWECPVSLQLSPSSNFQGGFFAVCPQLKVLAVCSDKEHLAHSEYSLPKYIKPSGHTLTVSLCFMLVQVYLALCFYIQSHDAETT